MNYRKPEVGLLGIMQELYDDMLPGITERQGKYATRVAEELSAIADVYFDKPARNREDIEKQVKKFNNQGLDGIMIVMLTYSPGLRLVRAVQKNDLPLLVANIQPVPTITEDWDMADLTYNQGIHGAQDNMNAILRAGIDCPVITGNWQDDKFKNSFAIWARAAMTLSEMKRMKVATIGQMPGMGDILVNPAAFLRKIGPQVEHESMGTIYRYFEGVTAAEIEEVMAENEKNFTIDPELPEADYRYAARLQVAIEKMLQAGDYEAFSIYFNAVADDGRFRQLPMMAASNLLAKGYGYGAEGDVCAASLVAAGHRLIGDAHFAEMYAMDFERDSILISHMGEGNWKVGRRDEKPELIDRELGIGGLGNPPTVRFRAEPGPATLASLVALPGDEFRLVVAKGTVLDSTRVENIEMPYFHFRPETGVRRCQDGWLENGGTHHQCFNLGDHRDKWQMFCRLLGIEYVEV